MAAPINPNALALSAGLAASLQRSLAGLQRPSPASTPEFAATVQRLQRDLTALQSMAANAGVSHPFFRPGETPPSPAIPILEALLHATQHQTGNPLNVATLNLQTGDPIDKAIVLQSIQRTAEFLQSLSLLLTLVDGQFPDEETLLRRAQELMTWRYQGKSSPPPAQGKGDAQEIREPVLFVDDEPDVPDLFSMILTGQGFWNVLTAVDVDSALMVFSEHPDLAALVTDYTMPGRNGVDLAREVWKTQPNLPVIFITGNVDAVEESLSEEELRKSRRILKPVENADDIGDLLKSMIRGK